METDKILAKCLMKSASGFALVLIWFVIPDIKPIDRTTSIGGKTTGEMPQFKRTDLSLEKM